MSAREQTPTRRAGVFEELALALREMVRDEHANSASGLERFVVQHADPLRVTQLHGDLILEDGDPDFSIGKAVIAAVPAVGDVVWVARSAGANPDFHAIDVVS